MVGTPEQPLEEISTLKVTIHGGCRGDLPESMAAVPDEHGLDSISV